MKEIQLSQGKFALVDDEDYEYLNQFKWFAHKHRGTYYARRSTQLNYKKTSYKMHRVIMNATNPNDIIDHCDLDGLNNQKGNLRRCTNSQNQANRPKRKFSKSKYKGVTPNQWKSSLKKWRAQIKINGKVIGLGYFENEIDAAKSYDKAAIIAHGEFANINFPIPAFEIVE